MIMCNFTVSSCYLAVWKILGLESKGRLLLVDLLVKAFYTSAFKAVYKQKLPSREVFEALRDNMSATKQSHGGEVAT